MVCDGLDAVVHGEVVVLLRRSSWCCCVLLRRSSWCWCVLNSSSVPWYAPPSSQPDHFSQDHESANWNIYGKKIEKNGNNNLQWGRAGPAGQRSAKPLQIILQCLWKKIRNDQQLISHCFSHWQVEDFYGLSTDMDLLILQTSLYSKLCTVNIYVKCTQSKCVQCCTTGFL